MDEAWEDAIDEELPDVSGLAPVRSLDQLRSGPPPRRTPLEALRTGWGYSTFRPLQAEAVAGALAGKDVLVVLPTGGGKSLCYQVPAACGAGLVLVVSPLIALMDDQVAAAREAGLEAGALHSHVDASEKARLRDRAAAGTLQLLYVSPERLCLGDLLGEFGSRLALIAVDEAHCVSHWGHDFRPEYRQLRPVFERAKGVPRMALTATATPQVQDDIVTQLGLRLTQRLVGHIDRPNLVYRAVPRREQAKQVLEVVLRHPDEGGIVYAQTRRDVERLAAALQKQGISAAGYHAGMDPAVRRKVQDDFVNERIDVVTATIAFGMGIDRSNVRYVVHANCPKSIEHYQQESGRAGRDGEPAECVLLFAASDLTTHRELARKDGELSPDRARTLERQLRAIGSFAVAPTCRHHLLCEHFGQEYPASGSDGATGLAGPGPAGRASVVSTTNLGSESGGELPSAASRGGEVPPVQRRSEAAGLAGPGPAGRASGSDLHQCHACDVCLGETASLPSDEALTTAQKIISAAWRLDGRFGTGQVVDVLLGKKTDKVARGGHDRLSVFGLLKAGDEWTVRAWIDQLVVQGHLEITEEDRYSFLRMTDQGRALCKGEGAVRLGRFAVTGEGRRTRSRKPAAARSAPEGIATVDAGLFERLRQVRKLLAERQGVPPYLVFSDATLRALVAARPADVTALRAVKGVGETKLARYGAAFLAALSGADPAEAAGHSMAAGRASPST